MSKEKRAFSRKNNYWNDLRTANNVKFDQLAVLLDVSDSCVGNYFSGAVMPKNEVIKDLCDFFGIDFETGKNEFLKIHNSWLVEQDKNKTVAEPEKRKRPVRISNVKDVVKFFYGKLPCDEFLNLYNVITGTGSEGVDVLSSIYGTVDYATYNKIVNMLKEVQ